MKSTGWTELYISTLMRADPPNVGVVGPKHEGGNHDILTYDFVHRFVVLNCKDDLCHFNLD